MRSQRYSSDLTDAHWEAIKPLLARQRFLKHHPRHVLDALFYLTKTGCYLNKTGCQWRMLPEHFPPWQPVYYHFRRWAERGLLERLTEVLRCRVRREAGRHESPSAAIIDSQSLKTSHVGGERGFDGGKQDRTRSLKGRKRHVLTDTLGLLLAVLVHSAGIPDSQRAPHLLDRVRGKVPRLRGVFADEGYLGTPPGLIWRVFGWAWSVGHRESSQRGFVVLKKRWIVERTLAWFGGYRRLSKDYEYLPAVSEAMVQLSAIRMMLRRLA